MPVVLIDLAVAKQIGLLHNIIDQLHTARVIRCQVVTVRKMKRVNVIAGGIVLFINKLKRLPIYGRTNCSAAFSLWEKSSSETTLASVWWAINSISTVSYFVRKNGSSRKRSFWPCIFPKPPYCRLYPSWLKRRLLIRALWCHSTSYISGPPDKLGRTTVFLTLRFV